MGRGSCVGCYQAGTRKHKQVEAKAESRPSRKPQQWKARMSQQDRLVEKDADALKELRWEAARLSERLRAVTGKDRVTLEDKLALVARKRRDEKGGHITDKESWKGVSLLG